MGEAAVALVKAAHRYDPSLGVPFSAFARLGIKGALKDVVRTEARRESLRDGRFAEVTSLDEPTNNEVGWEIPDPRLLEDQIEAREVLRILAGIPAKERYALIRTQVDGAPASDVANELGVTAHRVYALVAMGSTRLRIRRAQAA